MYLPGVILKPTAAVSSRVTCWAWRDMGSMALSCPGGVGSCDHAGCLSRDKWCEDPDEITTNCYVSGDGKYLYPYCCVPFTGLTAMLQMQDKYMPQGGSGCGRGKCTKFEDERTWCDGPPTDVSATAADRQTLPPHPAQVLQ